MIELYIGGSQVVLPAKFSNKIIEENPFYTKNGKYTYDIELSLENPINARVYANLTRLNTNASFAPKTAVLVVYNRVLLNGVAIVQKVNRKTISLQLASGNSELNFYASLEKNIRDLDMGAVFYAEASTTDPDGIYIDESVVFQNDVFNYLNLEYPAKNFQLLSFYSNDLQQMQNEYIVSDDVNTNNVKYPCFMSSFRARPQPYLASIIDKLIESLGYVLSENCIGDHTLFKYYVLIHGYYTLEYAKMLPAWTVSEFLSKIEKRFNCTFVVNERNKTARLLFNSYLYEQDPNEVEVFDDHELEYETEQQPSLSNANLSYDLESNDITKYTKLEKDVYEYAFKDTYTTMGDLFSKVDADSNRLKTIYEGPMGQFMIVPDNTYTWLIKRVNQFKDYYQNASETIDETFDIIPVEMKPITDFIVDVSSYYNQYPVVSETHLDEADSSSDFILEDVIQGKFELPKTNASDKMYLVVYDGLKPYDWVGATPADAVEDFPTTWVVGLAEYYNGVIPARFFGSIDSFDLNWLADNIYSTVDIDTTKQIEKRFIYKPDIDITRPFIIGNKKFVCVKYELLFDQSGLSKVCTGYFYPVND